MLRFSKVFVLSLLVVGLCAPLALATTSRVQALGPASYINDDSDVFRWYGTLPSYSKMVMVEAGTFTGSDASYQALGFTHNWGEDHWLGTWAVFLLMNNTQDPSYYLFNQLPTPFMVPAITQVPTDPTVSMPSTKFALAWGQDLGQLSLGLMITRSDESTKFSGEDEIDYNFTTLGGGVRLDINEELYGDAAVTLGFAGGNPVTPDVATEPLLGWDKSTSSSLEGRLFWEFVENATLVPYFGLTSADFAFETAPVTNPAPTGDKWGTYAVGAGFNFDVNTNNVLVFAADVQGFNWKYSKAGGDKTELSEFVFPKFYVALESDVTSWFTFRVGATKTMVKTTVKDPEGDEYEFTYPIALVDTTGLDVGDLEALDPVGYIGDYAVLKADDFSWFMGGGFHVGEWDIDAVFSHELPFRLGYWLTGYGTENDTPIVGRVSATYRF